LKRFLFVFVAILVLPLSMAALDDAEAYYTHDNSNTSGGNSLDISGNNNDGTLNGGVTTGVSGIINEAYSFDGVDDYVNYSQRAPQSSTQPFSYSIWFKHNNLGSDIYGFLMQRREGSFPRWWFRDGLMEIGLKKAPTSCSCETAMIMMMGIGITPY